MHGLGWKTVSAVFLQASRLVVGIILARLLTPSDFGLAAMALVFSAFVIVFSDLALGAALVQRVRITEEDVSTVFWTGLAAGVALTAAGYFASGAIAHFYRDDAVKPLFQVLSVTFVITSLGTTQATLLTREMRFRALELRVIVGTVAGAVVGVGLAATGFGAWAIIGQQVAAVTASTALLWRCSGWRPTFVFSWASLRDLGGFSANVFGQRLTYTIHRNADNLLVGRYIGSAALGAYSLAYNVMLLPFSRIAGPVQQVMFPAFARKQDDRAWIVDAWVRVTRTVGAITVPCLLGLVVVAPDFVPAVLGDRWSSVTRLLQVLAWVGLLQSLQTVNGDILQALDRTTLLFRFTVLFVIAHLAGFVIGLHWGVLGVATAYAVASTFLEPAFAVVTARAVGTSPLTIVRALAGVATAAVVMVCAVAGTRVGLTSLGIRPGARLIVEVAVGAAVYLPLVVVMAPSLRRDVQSLRRRARTTPPPAAEAILLDDYDALTGTFSGPSELLAPVPPGTDA